MRLQVLNFSPTYQAVTDQILQIVKDHESEAGKNNPYVVEIKELIAQALVPGVEQSIQPLEEIAKDLETWGEKMQAALNALASGATNIQSAGSTLQGDIEKLNNAIKSLDTSIAASTDAWGVFQVELQELVDTLESAEESISVIIQGVFTSVAQKEWHEATTTANALVNRKITMEFKTLPMDSNQPA